MKPTPQKSHYINAQWIHTNHTPLVSINPANNEVVWEGSMASQEEIELAFEGARQALTPWSRLAFEKRAHYALAFANAVTKRKDALMKQISAETGKPLWESATEVNSVIAKIALSIKAYEQRCPFQQTQTPEGNNTLRYKPHGIVVVLGPFNFPAHLSNGHIVPALLAGNTVLYKPSELTPGVAALIMQCFDDAQLPPGVIQCLQGNASVAKQLLTGDMQAVFFTGSYASGLQINQQMASRPEVLLALEMGGNNPLIVDDFDNLNAAIYQTLLSTMMTAGQRCTSARRLLIPKNRKGDHFLQQLLKACQSLVIGSFSSTPEPFMGPVIRHEHAIAHLSKQSALIAAGGKSLLEMTLLKPNTGFLSPGLVDMTDAMHSQDEEIFAPLLQIFRYHSFEEALAIANQTQYGLVAGLISPDEKKFHHFFENIRAGLINWNRPTTGAASNLPFGGVGKSGNHRPSAYFAADYCAYPIASLEQNVLQMPAVCLPGIRLET